MMVSYGAATSCACVLLLGHTGILRYMAKTIFCIISTGLLYEGLGTYFCLDILLIVRSEARWNVREGWERLTLGLWTTTLIRAKCSLDSILLPCSSRKIQGIITALWDNSNVWKILFKVLKKTLKVPGCAIATNWTFFFD